MDYKELFSQLLKLSKDSKLRFKIDINNILDYDWHDSISIFISQQDTTNTVRITDFELLKDLTEDKFHELVKDQEVKSKIASLKQFELTDEEIQNIINKR